MSCGDLWNRAAHSAFECSIWSKLLTHAFVADSVLGVRKKGITYTTAAATITIATTLRYTFVFKSCKTKSKNCACQQESLLEQRERAASKAAIYWRNSAARFVQPPLTA